MLALAFVPFIFPGVKALNVAAKILVFVVLVASFDLLLGYTGIVSFAHTMFFGIGAYGIAIACTRMGAGLVAPSRRGWPVAGALVRARAGIGLFSLRVRAIFFSHDHAGRGRRFPDPGIAAVGHHRRRGRPDLQGAGDVSPGFQCRRSHSWA